MDLYISSAPHPHNSSCRVSIPSSGTLSHCDPHGKISRRVMHVGGLRQHTVQGGAPRTGHCARTGSVYIKYNLLGLDVADSLLWNDLQWLHHTTVKSYMNMLVYLCYATFYAYALPSVQRPLPCSARLLVVEPGVLLLDPRVKMP